MPQAYDDGSFEFDHIIAVSHGGVTAASNICLACFSCNSFKGPNLSGVDEKTGKVVPLFHPRRQKWRRHFQWDGPRLIGRTAPGRATIATLRINLDHRAPTDANSWTKDYFRLSEFTIPLPPFRTAP
jgi:hypothetical protein